MTTTNEWRDLPTFEDVADAKRAGDEIEVNTGPHWESWKGTAWMNYMGYRARPAQPKMKKVKILGWLNPETGCTTTRLVDSVWTGWVRYPRLDDEVEVPE